MFVRYFALTTSEIYDIINYIKSDVQTIGVGSIASMASIILINGTKGKKWFDSAFRFCSPNHWE